MSATQPTPHRVQLRRTKGWRKPPNTVSVARPTKWGNPFRVATGCQSNPEWSRSMVVALFRNDLRSAIEDPWGKSQSIEVRAIAESIEELRGKNLACWCPLDQPCHADVLLEMANSDTINRPTLYDVASRIDAVHQDHPQAYAAVDMLDYLTEHGYAIVRADELRPQVERVILRALEWSDAGGCAPDRNDFDDIIAASDSIFGAADVWCVRCGEVDIDCRCGRRKRLAGG